MSLAQLLNQNSYLLAALTLFLVASISVIARFRKTPLAWFALIVLGMLLIAGDWVLRVGASEIESTAQFDQILSAHQPLVLEIYSNY